MNDQEEYSSGCFPCPVQASCSNTTPLQKQKTTLTHLLNAFPQLAVKHDLYTPRTNPFIRTIYWPRDFLNDDDATILDFHFDELKLDHGKKDNYGAKPTSDDRDNLQAQFIYIHEVTHINFLGWTPAKDLARLVLAACYDRLGQLLFDPADQVEIAWEKFKALTMKYKQIIHNITFVEELFADALAFGVLEHNLRLETETWKRYKELLRNFEREVLRKENKSFPGFRNAYKRIQPIIDNVIHNPDSWFFIPLFQPPNEEYVKLTDVQENLSHQIELFDIQRVKEKSPELIEAEENLNNAKLEMVRLLSEENTEECVKLAAADKLEDYINKLASLSPIYDSFLKLLDKWEDIFRQDLLEDHSSSLNPFIEMLWRISYGSPPLGEKSTESFRDYAIKTMYDSTDLPRSLEVSQHTIPAFFTLVSDVNNGQEYIRIKIYCAKDKVDSELGFLVEVMENLLFFEGLRQQLITKKGIICPLNQGKKYCRCDPSLRAALVRLYHRAKYNLFGDGEWPEWKPLPCTARELISPLERERMKERIGFLNHLMHSAYRYMHQPIYVKRTPAKRAL